MANKSLLLRHTVEHFYLGIFITAFYIFALPTVVNMGYPGLAGLLLAELLVLAPIICAHLFYRAQQINGNWSLDNVILFRERIGRRSFLLWFVGGLVAIILIYLPLYPVGLVMREQVFGWLPEWYFNPAYGAQAASTLATMFLIAIVIDGLIGPVCEELFFRGYLLPRMSYLKGWAPVVNGVFFGLYHFWQPHNLIALMAVGVILSYIVWKTRNVYLGIALHCTINVLGAAGGYFAVISGVEIGR